MEQTPSCKYFRLLADEYIEGELTTEEMREFEAHIAECPACRKEFLELRALKEMLAESDEEIPEGLHERIMAAVGGETKPQRRKYRVLRRAAVSAACAVICLSLTLIFALMPLWRRSNETSLPDSYDTRPSASTDTVAPSDIEAEENISSETSPETLDEAANPTPEVPEGTQSEHDDPGNSAVDALPDTNAPATTPELTQSVGEMVPTETAAPESTAPTAEMTGELPELVEPATEAMTSAADTYPAFDEDAPSASESSSAPGGEEITLALLIVSGLLAVASFIAFLISLSSVRNIPSKKNGEEK